MLLHVGILRKEVGVVAVLGRGQQGFDVGLLLFEARDELFLLGHGALGLADDFGALLLLLVGEFARALGGWFFGRRLGRSGFAFGQMEFVERFDVLLVQEIVDAAQMFAHLSAAKLVHLIHQSVQKLAVVADENHGAVERLNGFFEHVLRAHVEVVGWLVENQEIDGLEQKFYHGQSAALAATQHLDLLVGGFAAKHKSTEDVANLQADIARGHAVNGVEDGEILVQQLCLVLGIVAYLYVVAELQAAAVVDFLHDALDEGGLACAVLAHEGHFLAALDGEVYIVKHTMRAVVLAQVFANDGIVARTRTGRKLQVERGGVYLVHFDGHHFLQLLDAALHLHGLGGFVAEAFDEVANVGHLLLLVLVGPQLLLATLGAQAHKFVVLHLVVRNLPTGNFEGAVGHVVDKGAVVADQHHTATAARQELFEPADALYVEVVGRFVEQQHIGAAQEEFGQLYAHTPTARELARRAVPVCALKAQTQQRALHLGAVVHAAHHTETLALVGKPLDQRHVFGRFVVGALGQFVVHAGYLVLQVADMGESGLGLFDDGMLVLQHHHLGQVTDGGLARGGNRAACGLLQTSEYFK